MIVTEQIPRRALLWLIACQLVVVAPHLARAPVWVLLVYLLTAAWRLQVCREKATIPGWGVRLVLALSAAAGVAVSYQSLIGLEPMVALLLVAAALKLLEAVRARDGYLLVCLAFFTCVTQFLFSQTLPVVLYTMVSTVVLVTALIALNTRPDARLSSQEPLLAMRMLGLAIPMMVVLFLLFPRIGPLWSVPSKNGEGISGMSDTLRPGEVSKLGRSAEVAFRVQFDGDIPAKSELYWRGMVLNHFENGAWRILDWREHPPADRLRVRPETRGQSISYQVVMEPTLQRWLYALPYAESGTPGVLETWDYRLGVLDPVENQIGYRVTSWQDAIYQPELSQWRRQTELDFPEDLNPRTRAWVTRTLADNPAPEAFVAAVLRFFRQQPFYYTLEPPSIPGLNFVDDFVFESRRGFCEHYAYSFVVMMRMAGIPARIIGGYQGGETNPLNNSVIVRQFDAHAWAEVWFEGVGWQRVDPTGAVSPARVELGLQDALAGQEAGFLADSPFSAYRFRGIDAINWLRLRYDAVAWRWQTFVVGFNHDKQLGLLKDWFGEINVTWFTAVLLGSWFIVLAPLTWWINRSRRSTDLLASERLFLKLVARLERRGLNREAGESPVALLARARAQLPPEDRLIRELAEVVDAMYRAPATVAV